MGLKIPETISEDELKKILEGTKKPQHKLAFALGFYQAMRVSEVVKLQPEDVDKGSHLIHIKQAKGGKDRIIPIAPEVLKGLKFLPVKCGVRALEIAVKKKAAVAIQKNIHFHTLRHSGATHYLNVKRWSTRQVQVFLGHSKITTTEIYTHVTPQDLLDLMWGSQ